MTKKDNLHRLELSIRELANGDDILASSDRGDHQRRHLLDLISIHSRIVPLWSRSKPWIGLYLIVCIVVVVSAIVPVEYVYSPRMIARLSADTFQFDVAHSHETIDTNVLSVRRLLLRLSGEISADDTSVEEFVNAILEVGGDLTLVTRDDALMAFDLPEIVDTHTVRIERLSRNDGSREWSIEATTDNAHEYGVTIPAGTRLESTVESQKNIYVEREIEILISNAKRLYVEISPLDQRIGLFNLRIPISKITFQHAGAGETPYPRSGVVGGEIQLPDIDERFDLWPWGELALDIDDGRTVAMLSLSIGKDDPADLLIEGNVDRLAVDGRSGLPNVMTYVSKSKYVSLAWTSLVAITGFFFILIQYTSRLPKIRK